MARFSKNTKFYCCSRSNAKTTNTAYYPRACGKPKIVWAATAVRLCVHGKYRYTWGYVNCTLFSVSRCTRRCCSRRKFFLVHPVHVSLQFRHHRVSSRSSIALNHLSVTHRTLNSFFFIYLLVYALLTDFSLPQTIFIYFHSPSPILPHLHNATSTTFLFPHCFTACLGFFKNIFQGISEAKCILIQI